MDGSEDGTTFTDSSSNNYTVTRYNAVTKTGKKKMGTASGYFDGNGDYLKADSAASAFGTGDFTIDFWTYTDSYNNQTPVFFDTRINTNSADTTGFAFSREIDGKLSVWIPSHNYVFNSLVLPLSQWNHVALVRSGGSVFAFLNGVKSTESYTITNSFSDQYGTIGTNINNRLGAANSLWWYYGYIDEFRVSNGIARWTSNFTNEYYGDITLTNTSGNDWTATHTMASGDGEGVMPFTIDFGDLAGNPATTYTETTDSSSIIFDKTGPSVTIASSVPDSTTALTVTANTAADGVEGTVAGSPFQYRFYRYTDSDCTTLAETSAYTANDVLSTQFINLSPNTQYFFKAQAKDSLGNEGSVSTACYSTNTYSLGDQVTDFTVNANYSVTKNYYTTVGWTNTNGTGLKIERDLSCDGTYETTIYDQTTPSPIPTTLDDTGLQANTCYQYRITSYNGAGVLNTVDTRPAASDTTPPAIPTNLTNSGNTTSSIDFNWDDMPAVVSYNVYSSADNYTSPVSTPTSSNYTKSSIAANSQFCIKVSTVNANGEGGKTSAYCAYASANTPTSAGHSSNTVSSITWTWASGGEQKDFYAWTDTPTANSEWTTDTSWALSSGISANTQYTFSVKARNEDLDETPDISASSYSSIEEPDGSPTLTALSSDSIQVDANGTFTNLTSDGSGLYFQNNTANVNSGWIQLTSWTNSSLSPNTQYTYTLKGRNGDGNNETSFSNTASRYTLATVPDAPTIADQSQLSTSVSVKINANTNPDATEYCVQRSIDNTWADTSKMYTLTNKTTPVWTQTNTCSFIAFNDVDIVSATGLVPNTTYAFRVKARNHENVETDWSSNGSDYTLANEPDIASTRDMSYWYNTSSFSFSSSRLTSGEIAYYRYVWDTNAGSSLTTCSDGTSWSSGSISKTATEAENNFLHILACNTTNKPSSSGVQNYGPYLFDETIPTVTDDYAYDNTWVNTNQTITLTPGDTGGSGIAQTKYCWGAACDLSSGLGIVGTEIIVSSTTDNTLRYKTTDTADNDSSIHSLDVKVDKEGPTDGSIDYQNGFQTMTSMAITVDRGTDASSGMSAQNADYLLEYRSAPLANSICGTYSAWTDTGVTETASGTSYNVTGIDATCYQFQYTVHDIAENSTTYTTGNTVKIDTIDPVLNITDNASGNWVRSETITTTLTENNPSILKWTFDNDGTCSNTASDYGNTYVSGATITVNTDHTDYICFYAEDSSGRKVTAATGQLKVDIQNPGLSNITIASNNADTTRAKVGDTITLSFTASEIIQNVAVTIDGVSATEIQNSSGDDWTATYVMASSDTEGVIPFTIDFVDRTDNAGTQTTATTDSSRVTFDRTNPQGVMTTTAFDPTNLQDIPITITFPETVSGFNSSDLVLQNATVKSGSFATTNNKVFTAILNATTDPANITANIAEATLLDLAGNPNNASEQWVIHFDSTIPSIASISTTANDGYYIAGTQIPITVVFSKPLKLEDGNILIHFNSGGTATISPFDDYTDTVQTTYTVESGDLSPQLDVTTASFSSNLALLHDLPGNHATLGLEHTTLFGSEKNIIVDAVPPILESVTLASNNSLSQSWARAKEGVTYTLNFSEPVKLQTLSSASRAQNASTLYQEFDMPDYATSDQIIFRVEQGDNGPVTLTNANFSIVDQAGNIISITQNTINALINDTVTADTIAPTISSVSISSNNATPTYAETHDEITITFFPSDNLSSSLSVVGGGTILSKPITSSNVTAGSSSTVKRFTDGTEDSITAIPFNFQIMDDAGNVSVAQTTVSDNSSVQFVKTSPWVSDISIISTSSDNSSYMGNFPEYYAKQGDTITLAFHETGLVTFQGTPSGTFFGQSVTMDDAGNGWWRKELTNVNGTEGPVPFAINITNTEDRTISISGTSIPHNRVIFDKHSPVAPSAINSTFTITDKKGAAATEQKHRLNAIFTISGAADNVSVTPVVSDIYFYDLQLTNSANGGETHKETDIFAPNNSFDATISNFGSSQGQRLPKRTTAYQVHVIISDRAGNKTTDEVVYTQKYTPGLYGKVSDENGTPLSGVVVQVVAAFGQTCDLVNDICATVTDENGNYNLPLQTGVDYTLFFYKNQYYVEQQTVAMTVQMESTNSDVLINKTLQIITNAKEKQRLNTSTTIILSNGAVLTVTSLTGEVTQTPQQNGTLLISSPSRIVSITASNSSVGIQDNNDNTFTISLYGSEGSGTSAESLTSISSTSGLAVQQLPGAGILPIRVSGMKRADFTPIEQLKLTPGESMAQVQKLNEGLVGKVLTYVNNNGFQIFAGYQAGKLPVEALNIAPQTKLTYRGGGDTTATSDNTQTSAPQTGFLSDIYDTTKGLIFQQDQTNTVNLPGVQLDSTRLLDTKEVARAIINRGIYQKQREEEQKAYVRVNEEAANRTPSIIRPAEEDKTPKIVIDGKSVPLKEMFSGELQKPTTGMSGAVSASQGPSVTIASSKVGVTNTSPFKIAITFSTEITGFEASNIKVMNGYADNLRNFDDKLYSADVYASGQGEMTIEIPSGVVLDKQGVGNMASDTFKIKYDPGSEIGQSSRRPQASIQEPQTFGFWNMVKYLYTSVFGETEK